jgi:hypothetical protein
VFALGVAVTVLELPTALPYLGAVGAITRAELAVAEWLPLLLLWLVGLVGFALLADALAHFGG